MAQTSFDVNWSASPAWLEFSGLPRELNAVRKHAWAVFKKLVELDCTAHPGGPGLIRIAPEEVGRRCGFEGAAVLKACLGFRRRGLIRAFLPEQPEEEMYFEIVAPLPVPREIAEIRADVEANVGHAAARAPWRYLNRPHGDARDESLHRQVVDMYLNYMSTAINATVVDELAILADRFPLAVLEDAFKTAAAREERRLSFVFRLLHERRRNERVAKGKPERRPAEKKPSLPSELFEDL